MRAVQSYLTFLSRSVRLAFVGDWRYYLWVGALGVVCLLGLNAYAKQFVHGLVVTGMSDQVSWGVYIANFTFLVGVAAAAVMLVIPVYVYKNEELEELVIFGELLAVAAILMCLAFVTVDLGRPDRFWHLMPGIGKFNFPGSMLSWDVVVLNGYLLLNVYICAYMLYSRYQGRHPSKWFYIPFVFIGIVWAVSIHTVTAFLYVGLGGRPFWNSAIVAPRFLASAFTAGPALIILALQVVRRVTSDSSPGAMSLERTATDLGLGRVAGLEDLDTLAVHLPALRDVSKEIRHECLAGAQVFDVPTGAVVTREGDTQTNSFFILSGRVLMRRQEGETYRVVRILTPGGLFGEIAALTGAPRTATAITDGPVQLLRLPAESLRRLMRDRKMHSLVKSSMARRVVISDRALLTLRSIVQVSMIINVFLLFNEVFKEFYTESLHGASAKYLYFGLHGYHALNPWIWTAIVCNLTAMVMLILPVSRSLKVLDIACVLAIVGIWIEKGMGLVIPGFIPTPLGEMVEYTPTLNEMLICFGIWAFGLLCYTVLLRMAVPILQGQISKANEPGSGLQDSDAQLRALVESQSSHKADVETAYH